MGELAPGRIEGVTASTMFLVLSLEKHADDVEYYGVFETVEAAEDWANQADRECEVKEVPLNPPKLEYKEIRYWRGWVDRETKELGFDEVVDRVLASKARPWKNLGYGYSTKSAEDAMEIARQIYNETIKNSYPTSLLHLAEDQFIQPRASDKPKEELDVWEVHIDTEKKAISVKPMTIERRPAGKNPFEWFYLARSEFSAKQAAEEVRHRHNATWGDVMNGDNAAFERHYFPDDCTFNIIQPEPREEEDLWAVGIDHERRCLVMADAAKMGRGRHDFLYFEKSEYTATQAGDKARTIFNDEIRKLYEGENLPPDWKVQILEPIQPLTKPA